jgi:hypothetical protein
MGQEHRKEEPQDLGKAKRKKIQALKKLGKKIKRN